ncbi:MAG: hypothetical protein KDB01_05380 [Planctomycetaceae bacterium]|nr:hypothetical protein [Planctomycetaceae bacterium]
MSNLERNLIIDLARKWQQKPIWLLACDLAKYVVESPADDPGYLQRAKSFAGLQNELANIENLIRYNAPQLLRLSPYVELMFDYKSVDIPLMIGRLLEIESNMLLSVSDSRNEGTTEGTKNATSGDNADNSETKPKRKFCDRCQQLKTNWFNRIRREKTDIPLQTFLKEFFANPRTEKIWNPVRKGKEVPTKWEAMEKKFRDNKTEWESHYLALVSDLRGTIGGQ